jgi:Kdo2-lipid IVA lauroyltransferase/acyltransferase
MSSWFKAWLIRGILRFFAVLPFAWAQRLGWCIGFTVSLLPSSLKRVSERNIALCFPELSAKQQQQLVRASLCELGCTIAETGAFWLWSGKRVLALVRQVKGEDKLTAALAAGRGVILAIPHLGAWELGNLYLSARYQVSALYRPLRMKPLEDYVYQARTRLGTRLLPTTARGVKALYQALNQGELVVILPDQEPGRAGQGVFAPFFDVPAYSSTLIARLAQKTGAPVVIGYAERLGIGRGFCLQASVVLDLREQDLATATATLNKAIEEGVRQCPSQYAWSYKRFKTAPEGEGKRY